MFYEATIDRSIISIQFYHHSHNVYSMEIPCNKPRKKKKRYSSTRLWLFAFLFSRFDAIYIKFSRCYSRLIFFPIRHYSILLGIVHHPSRLEESLLSSGSIGWKPFRLRPMHQTISRTNSNATRLLKNINVPANKLYIFQGCNKNNVEII